MNNGEDISTGTSSSSDSVLTDMTTDLQEQLRLLLSIWASLDKNQQSRFLKEPGNELASAIVDSLTWIYKWTKTRDDQDQRNPFKHFPQYSYFTVLHNAWLIEPVIFIEKSRTMMVSWWSAAEAVHYIMTHQPAKAIFWALDEARSLTLLDYAKVLYEQQHGALKKIFPLERPLDRQSYNQLELKDGGILVALPGKDPDRIRSEHPTIVIIDEAAFIENGGESFDIALSSRVPKMMCISSAAPGWFRLLTKDARPTSLEKYL
jgi:hypothetical protein